MIKVAILMSYYNGDQFVEGQIESILKQQVNNDIKVDLFIRDDGSTSSDLSILKQYEHEGKIKLFQGENIGVKLSFYRLLELVTGYDFYFFSDQDDIWREDKLQIMIDELLSQPNDIPIGVYSDLYVADKDAKPTGKLMKKGNDMVKPNDYLSTKKNILRSYLVTGASFGINDSARKLGVELGEEFFRETKMHDAALSLMLTAVGRLIYIDQPLVYYRQHGENLIGASSQKSMIKLVVSASHYLDGRIDRMYGLYRLSEIIDVKETTELKLIKKMMKSNILFSPIYIWKLRKLLITKHYIINEILFILFGIHTLKKRKIGKMI